MKALLVIDLQQGVCQQGEQQLYQLATLLERVNQRIVNYRENNLPIIFIQHEDEDLIKSSVPWQLHPDLLAMPTDFYVSKTHANSFFKTDLQATLTKLAVTDLEIWGAQTQFCMDATIKFAHGLGYNLISSHQASSTIDNQFLSAEETIQFYENIWQGRFVEFFKQ
ncbi:nicotinamidase-related amidase [Enterococcus sp. PF1-24]|uniref:cysteine hydrolase family protein n=1 Tax=unclassified Enterococcus TaxID=2608891 RepID=UPI0024767C90|nr:MULTISPECIES: cysteine hydrolase family protein [unclassified Enterococcus]MDH6363575.1 nicotinamidase-related amidase [Enterococcus sp. PFB1-1]MDH6400810.1 nicotinamidase-related amidase [Enterococcus sp. PF1-24]